MPCPKTNENFTVIFNKAVVNSTIININQGRPLLHISGQSLHQSMSDENATVIKSRCDIACVKQPVGSERP